MSIREACGRSNCLQGSGSAYKIDVNPQSCRVYVIIIPLFTIGLVVVIGL